jgi:deferrochelatase/peroxidase EfeB
MSKCPFSALVSRRSFFKTAGHGVGLLAATTGLGALTSKIAEAATPAVAPPHPVQDGPLPFFGAKQAGILTPQQGHTYFVAFDLITQKKEDVIQLLKDWTAASELLTQGKPVKVREQKKYVSPGEEDSYSLQSTADSGETKGLPTSRLTLTFGFGPGLFETKDKKDRYGLAKFRPEALVDLPKFHGDELIEAQSGGDISVQACSDDPQVAFHAVRQLARFATDIATIRWAQTGFLSGGHASETPRNLMGFKDGTQQPKPHEQDKYIWASQNPNSWMHGGTYLVARKIRVALEHWDGTEVDFQEKVIGRKKGTGAPLGQKHEREVMNLSAVDNDGNFIIPENAHVRLAAAASNDGAQMLRRGYSYNDGVNVTAERWPPWRQGMEYDAGLFFVSYQSDPRTAFIKIFANMAKLDALNQFATHVTSAVFACPPGITKKGEYIGQKLFEKSTLG